MILTAVAEVASSRSGVVAHNGLSKSRCGSGDVAFLYQKSTWNSWSIGFANMVLPFQKKNQIKGVKRLIQTYIPLY